MTGVRSILDMLRCVTNPHSTTIYPFPDNVDVTPVFVWQMVRKFGVLFYPEVVVTRSKRVLATNGVYCPYFVIKETYRHLKPKLVGLLKKENINTVEPFEDLLVLSKKPTVSLVNIKKILTTLVSGLGWGDDWDFKDNILTLNDNSSRFSFVTFEYIMRRIDGLTDTDFFKKVRSNNLKFLYNNLGIEAVRTYLMQTIPAVLEKEGINIALSHVEFLIDNMTYQGHISPYTRSGVDVHNSVFLRASFETTVNTLSEASAEMLRDDIKCPTSSILFGKPSQIGTMYGLTIIEKDKDLGDVDDEVIEYAPMETYRNTEQQQDEVGFHFYDSDYENDDESPKRQKVTDSPEYEIELEL